MSQKQFLIQCKKLEIFPKHLLFMKNSLNYANILNNATQYNKLQNELIYDTLNINILNSRYRYNINFIVKNFLITHIETILCENQKFVKKQSYLLHRENCVT